MDEYEGEFTIIDKPW